MVQRNYFYIDPFDDLSLCRQKLNSEYRPGTIIGITVFIPAVSSVHFFQKRKQIQTFFHEHFGYLPVSVISQAASEKIALEIWVNETCKHLEYKESHGINYSVFEDEAGKMLWGFGTSTNQPELSFREQAYSAFELLHALLSAEGYSMDDLVRQWNYIPDILKTITENSRTYQHYQLFNDIRQYYYGMYKQKAAYPAATGIGMDFGPVTIDFCAIQKKDSTRIIDLSNPNQMNAYCYGQDVLAGSPSRENERKKAPLFERAKYIDAENGNGWAFISGTASICGENTAGLNDIVTQTLITMDNIECLTSMDNLNIKPVSAMMKKYSYFRVYVKDPNDISPVMELCRKQYPNTPILYVKADICRDNLLVEIEGEAFLSRIR